MIPSFSWLNTRVFVSTAWGVILWVAFVSPSVFTASLGAVLCLASIFWGVRVAAHEFGLSPGKVLGRAANIVTLSRLVLVHFGIVCGITYLQRASYPESRLLVTLSAVFIILAVLTDLIDGLVARRWGGSDPAFRTIGGWLDAEVDSLCFVLLSWVLAPLIEPWVAYIGLYRFAFGLLFRVFPWSFAFPVWFKWFSKSISAFTQVVLVAAWLALTGIPAFPPTSWAVVVYLSIMLSTVLLAVSFLIETVLRIRAVLGEYKGDKRSALPGLFRSVQIYHNLPFQQTRLRRFYSHFLKPGDVAFDVGAHVGNRVRAFHDMGCRVVAFEPQSSCLPLLEHWFGSLKNVDIVPEALGPAETSMEFHISTKNPTLSTVSTGWISDVEKVESFAGTAWDRVERVKVGTLDKSIETYGEPAFVKIDVEGFEHEVLKGLSRRLRVLSFEYLPASKESALACIDTVEAMGGYVYNLSVSEHARFHYKDWVPAADIRAFLAGLGPLDKSGDIYARAMT